jgi:hypothetical protein
LSSDLIAEYKALGLDQERSLIFWGGVLGIHGIRDTKDDLDVLVTEDYYQELLSKRHYSEAKPGKIVLDNIDICNSEAGLCNFADEAMRQGEMIDGMHFMSLQNLIRIKTARRRPKDLADVAMIYHYFRKNASK